MRKATAKSKSQLPESQETLDDNSNRIEVKLPKLFQDAKVDIPNQSQEIMFPRLGLTPRVTLRRILGSQIMDTGVERTVPNTMTWDNVQRALQLADDHRAGKVNIRGKTQPCDCNWCRDRPGTSTQQGGISREQLQNALDFEAANRRPIGTIDMKSISCTCGLCRENSSTDDDLPDLQERAPEAKKEEAEDTKDNKANFNLSLPEYVEGEEDTKFNIKDKKPQSHLPALVESDDEDDSIPSQNSSIKTPTPPHRKAYYWGGRNRIEVEWDDDFFVESFLHCQSDYRDSSSDGSVPGHPRPDPNLVDYPDTPRQGTASTGFRLPAPASSNGAPELKADTTDEDQEDLEDEGGSAKAVKAP